MNPRPKKGKVFLPGQSGNPKGSSAKQKTLGKITKMTNDQVSEVATLILEGDVLALEAAASSQTGKVMQWWISNLVLKSADKGDPAVFRALLDRIIGKPKEAMELTGKDGAPLVTETLADMEAKLALIRKHKEELGDD